MMSRTTQRFFCIWCLLLVVMLPALTSAETKLVFWTNWGGAAGDALRAALDDFENRNPGVKADMEIGVGTDKVIVASAAGVAPNAFVTLSLPSLAAEGYLQPLDNFIASSKVINQKEYPRDVWESLRMNGSIYGIPALEAGPIFALNWNEQHLAEAGLTPFSRGQVPTYDEVLAYSHKLTRLSADGVLQRLGYLPWGGCQGELEWWSLSFNEPWVNPDQTVTLSKPGLINGLELISREIYQRYGGALTEFFDRGDGASYSGALRKHTVSMSGDGYWAPAAWKQNNPDDRFGVTWMPNVARLKMQNVGGWRIAIPRGVSHLTESWKLVEFLAGPEGTLYMFKGAGFVTPNLSFIRRADFRLYPGLDFYMTGLGEADMVDVPTALPYASAVRSTWWSIAPRILRGEISPMAGLEEADRTIKAKAAEFEKK